MLSSYTYAYKWCTCVACKRNSSSSIIIKPCLSLAGARPPLLALSHSLTVRLSCVQHLCNVLCYRLLGRWSEFCASAAWTALANEEMMSFSTHNPAGPQGWRLVRMLISLISFLFTHLGLTCSESHVPMPCKSCKSDRANVPESALMYAADKKSSRKSSHVCGRQEELSTHNVLSPPV